MAEADQPEDRARVYPHLVIAVPVLLFILLTALSIHGSSLAVYDDFLGLNTRPDPNLLYGQPRSIRSDEFLVNTPLAVGEQRVAFRALNPNVGLGENVAVYSGTPAWSWKAFFDPVSWPYRVLPLPNAFAASWWLRDLLLLIGAYLALMVLTDGSVVLSVGVAIALLYAPFVQWWRGAALGAPAYGFLLLYCAFQVLIRPSVRGRLLSGLALGFFATCFAFVLYPPFQIPIALVALFLFAGFAVQQRTTWMSRKMVWTIAAFVTAGGIVVIAAAAYYLSFRAQIHLLTNTVYPGRRAETGGGTPWMDFFNGFFNIQLLNDANGVGPFGNQSEASNFFMIFPFVVPVYLVGVAWRWKTGERGDPVLIALAACLLVLALWVFVGLPGIVARLTLLDVVPAHRAIIGIGVADLIFLAVLLSRGCSQGGPIFLAVGACAAAVAFAVQLNLGLSLMSDYPRFIGNAVLVILIATVAGACALLANWGMKRAFTAVLVAYCLVSAAGVNPLYRGIDPIVGTRFADAIRAIDHRDAGRHRWVVYDSLLWGNYIVANGGDSLSAVYLYPQLNLWRRFDPGGRYSAVYNRYAHVLFSVPAAGTGRFTLLQPDEFSVNVSPCSSVLRALGVRYFVFGSKVSFPCLRLQAGNLSPAHNVFIYRRIA
jgi:hypothetical protein